MGGFFSFMRLLYLVVGLFSFALGSIGIFVVILPTVPFYLLAAFCFAKSSKKLETWFKNSRFYKENVESFRSEQGMTKKKKYQIMLSVTLVMAFAFYMMRNTMIGRIVLSMVWLAHIIGITFFVKTYQENPPQE